MKPHYHYPEMFLHKNADLYWAAGHPAEKVRPEERWLALETEARRRIRPEDIGENRPQLRLPSEFGEIDYVRLGPEGAPTLLLIPGFPDSWYTYHKILPILARSFDVIAYSPPGHGYSTYSDLFDFRIDTYCLIARLVLKRLLVRKVHLIGHSCGGEQVLRTTLQMKGLGIIQSIILINAWGPSVFPRPTKWEFSDDVTTWPIVGRELVRLFGGRLGGMQDVFRRVFYRPEEHVDEIGEQISRPLLQRTTFNLFVNRESAEAIGRMQSEQKQINETVREYFTETRRKYGYLPKIPVLVIGTKHDRIFPYTYARGLFRSIHKHNPQTFFRNIKPSGHMPALETPNRLAYQIRSFVEKQIAGTLPAAAPALDLESNGRDE